MVTSKAGKLNRTSAHVTATALRNYLLLASTYVLLIFLLPTDKQTLELYHLQSLAYRVLLFALALPSMLAWLAAFYSYAKLREYAQSVTTPEDSHHFHRLATGVTWLAWSLPVTIITSLILTNVANQHGGFRPTAIILITYLMLIFALVGFTIIGGAVREIVKRAYLQLSAASSRGIVLLFAATGVFYCYFTFQHFDLASLSSSHNPYYLPIWLMVLTVVVPYLYAWFVGLVAIYEMSVFSKQVKGVFFRQALRLLAIGLSCVIFSSIALEYINSISPRSGHLLLNYRLMMLLLFRIIRGAGFALIAMGALKLKKIEEV